MEVMKKKLSESDTTNRRLEFPAGSLWAFPMPHGQNSELNLGYFFIKLKVSVRNEGRYAKPWLKGEWGDYVHQKQLRKGDRAILTMNDEENGERIYRINAERKHFVTSLYKWKHEVGLNRNSKWKHEAGRKQRLSLGAVRSSLWLCNEFGQIYCICYQFLHLLFGLFYCLRRHSNRDDSCIFTLLLYTKESNMDE
ncbi:tyrosyl-DNA phosphodiesterase [Salix suchowensis]|nr:tyrosyl-DNA phosphodiesterase [Salix suchowensis]